MKTYNELVAELVAGGVPEAVAQTVAATRLAELATAVEAAAIESAKRADTGINDAGLPCVMVKGKKGAILPVSPCRQVAFVPGDSDGKVEYGPALILHYDEYVTGSGYVSPKSVFASSGSHTSTIEPEQSAAWQLADILAADPGTRLFIQDERGTAAIEFTDRAEWLLTVQEKIEEFYCQIATARKMVAQRGR